MQVRLRFWLVGVLCVALAAAWYLSRREPPDVLWEKHSWAGWVAVTKGNQDEALRQYTAALRVAEGFPPGDARLITSLDTLARNYSARKKHAEAEALYKRAVEVSERTLGPDHPSVALRLSALAGFYTFPPQRLLEARPLYERALAIREKTLGPEHPSVADSLTSLASTYYGQANYAQTVLPMYERALAIRRKSLRPEDPRLADSMFSLAINYAALGKDADAEPLYKGALAMHEKAYGPDSPFVGQVLERYGMLLSKAGRKAEGAAMQTRAEAIRAKQVRPPPRAQASPLPTTRP